MSTSYLDIVILHYFSLGGSFYFCPELLNSDESSFFQQLQKLNPKGNLFRSISVNELLGDLNQKILDSGSYFPLFLQKNDVLFLGHIEIELLKQISKSQSCLILTAKPHHESLVDFVLQTTGLDSSSWLVDESKFRALSSATNSINKTVFLDRDDVIVKNVPYNNNPDLVELIPGVADFINHAHVKGYKVIICSNQSGIGRGKISVEEYHKVHSEMLRKLALLGAWIEECLWAPYIEQTLNLYSMDNIQARKPRSGMFLVAQRKWSVNMSESLMVGDSATDLFAAHMAGVKSKILLLSEHLDAAKKQSELEKLREFSNQFSDFKYQAVTSFAEVTL